LALNSTAPAVENNARWRKSPKFASSSRSLFLNALGFLSTSTGSRSSAWTWPQQSTLGFFNVDDELLATYSCVLFNEYLDRCKKEWLDYLGKIGTPKTVLETSWRPSASRISKIEPVTAWFLARNGDEAEIRCYTHSLGDVLVAGRAETPEKVRAYPTALLKSSLETQKLLIVSLFGG